MGAGVAGFSGPFCPQPASDETTPHTRQKLTTIEDAGEGKLGWRGMDENAEENAEMTRVKNRKDGSTA